MFHEIVTLITMECKFRYQEQLAGQQFISFLVDINLPFSFGNQVKPIKRTDNILIIPPGFHPGMIGIKQRQ